MGENLLETKPQVNAQLALPQIEGTECNAYNSHSTDIISFRNSF